MTLKFLEDVFHTATFLISPLPRKVINFDTTIERLIHTMPSYTYLHILLLWLTQFAPLQQMKIRFSIH
jgi:hypothetical protein